MAGETWLNSDGKRLIDSDGKTLVCDDCPCAETYPKLLRCPDGNEEKFVDDDNTTFSHGGSETSWGDFNSGRVFELTGSTPKECWSLTTSSTPGSVETVTVYESLGDCASCRICEDEDAEFYENSEIDVKFTGSISVSNYGDLDPVVQMLFDWFSGQIGAKYTLAMCSCNYFATEVYIGEHSPDAPGTRNAQHALVSASYTASGWTVGVTGSDEYSWGTDFPGKPAPGTAGSCTSIGESSYPDGGMTIEATGVGGAGAVSGTHTASAATVDITDATITESIGVEITPRNIVDVSSP